MHAITKTVQIEDQYPGVALGVIVRPRGLVQIDAPPSPEDSRAWRATLMNLSGGPERALVNLDSHPDRTLGARAMDCTVIAHEKTAQTFRSRPNTFKAQGEETGAEWESIPGLSNVRWAPPEISFDEQLTLYWDGGPILLESRPGPSAGAIWASLPEEKIVFIGDAVVKNQPPFLANADLPAWIETLNLLLGPAYKSYTIISSRGGVVNAQTIRNQLDFIKHVREKLEHLAAKKALPSATEGLVADLASGFKASAIRQKHYAQRLRYGLANYYARHYHASSNTTAEDQS
jgi:glyoxylase-like metal-dependent hydrolase (beta-lactamase superfamily II)